VVLEVYAAETVDDVKAKIYLAEGIPPMQQGLSFRGRALEDDCTLAECNVGKEAELFVSMRLRGGCCWAFSIMIIIMIMMLTCVAPITCGTSLCIVPFLVPPLLILPCFCL